MTEDDDEFGPPGDGLEMGSTIDSETHEDVDPFEELGIGSRGHKAPTNNDGNGGYDALSDLMGEDDDSDFQPLEEIQNTNPDALINDEMKGAESTYVMLLQTVWVDGILDPAEVRLLAKKRVELDISFDRHLELVEELIGRI
tara:strand:- start:334 stop:759 length:426 start_codon:yes stop_codon:yes gene_type:complete